MNSTTGTYSEVFNNNIASNDNFRIADNSGEGHSHCRPFVASKAIMNGTIVAFDGSGNMDVATPTSKDICLTEGIIATTDGDFATAGKSRGVFPLEYGYRINGRFVGGVPTVADIGHCFNIDATGTAIDYATKSTTAGSFEFVEMSGDNNTFADIGGAVAPGTPQVNRGVFIVRRSAF